MRSQEMAGKILSVCVQEHVKDSQRDHEEGPWPPEELGS